MTNKVLMLNYPLVSSVLNSITELNITIETASLTIASPYSTIYSFGCSSSLTIDSAEIASVEQSNAHIKRISKLVS